MADFDISTYLKNLSPTKTYKGTDITYVVIARKGNTELALHLDIGESNIVYNKKPRRTIGFGLRLIQVGGTEFSSFGKRNDSGYFVDANGTYAGTRIYKGYLPVTNFPMSGKEFNALATAAIQRLSAWLKGKVEAAGAEMTLDDTGLDNALRLGLEAVDSEILDLFHLPDEKPEWLINGNQLPPTKKEDEQ